MKGLCDRMEESLRELLHEKARKAFSKPYLRAAADVAINDVSITANVVNRVLRGEMDQLASDV